YARARRGAAPGRGGFRARSSGGNLFHGRPAILRRGQVVEKCHGASPAGLVVGGTAIPRGGTSRQPYQSGRHRWRNLIPVCIPGTRILSLLGSNEISRQDSDRRIRHHRGGRKVIGLRPCARSVSLTLFWLGVRGLFGSRTEPDRGKV